MSENKKTPKPEEVPKKTEVAVAKKKTPTVIKPVKKTTALARSQPLSLWQAFDNTFERFRNDFEDLLFPANWSEVYSIVPEVRVPVVDLEDHGKEYVLKAEMPGFKKEDIEIEVQDSSIAITGRAGWKYDKQSKSYICKERACETFSREVALPEEINIDDVKADLKDGVLQVILTKKAPKQKRKVTVK